MESVVHRPARKAFPRSARGGRAARFPAGGDSAWRSLLWGALCFALLLPACRPSFTPVDLKPGDMCAKCRNPIKNPRMAGEITFLGGETMKFDDLGCLVAFHFGIDSATARGVFVQDYNGGGWIGEEDAFVLLHSSIVTPRYSNTVAFSTEAAARKTRATEGGTLLPLTAILKRESIWMEQSPR